MPFVEAALNDAQEASVVPEGTYDLRVIKVEDRNSKAGKPMTVLTVQIEDQDFPNAELMNIYIMHPHPDDEPRIRNLRLLDMRRAAECFGVPYEANGLNTDDFQGATARAVSVRQSEQPGRDGRPPRIVNEVQLPKLRSEDSAQAQAPRRAAGRR